MDDRLREKFERLSNHLRKLESVAVAFSAGADSTLILKVAVDQLGPENVVAVTARSPSVPAAELAEARRLAKLVGAEHVIIDTDEFDNSSYTANPANRCYFCKTTLYTHMERFIRLRGIKWIVNGSNADDLGDWRPGLTAASEHHVASPAVEASLSKQEIRVLSAELKLPTFDKPASPCLSSRIPYGQEVTPEKLRAVEVSENFLRTQFSVRECRVRHYGDLARVEVPPQFIDALNRPSNKRRIDAFFESVGFGRVEIDPRGFRSGSLNEVIAFGRRQ